MNPNELFDFDDDGNMTQGIGKWMTRDPLGEDSDFNLYRSVGNKQATNIFRARMLTTEGGIFFE